MSYCLTPSHFFFCWFIRQNKHRNRNDLNFPGTFHLAAEWLLHTDEWQHVNAAKAASWTRQNKLKTKKIKNKEMHKNCVSYSQRNIFNRRLWPKFPVVAANIPLSGWAAQCCHCLILLILVCFPSDLEL